MMRRVGFVAAWAAATVLSVFIAAWAVGGVRDQVTDRPALLPDESVIATTRVEGTDSTTTQPSGSASASTTAHPEVASGEGTSPTTTTTTTTTSAPLASPSSTTTTAAPSTSVTPPPPRSTSSTTTTTTPTTTTSTTVAAFELAQYQLLGGVVVLRSRPGEVEVVSAVPNTGYEVSIDQKGRASVEVEFEASDPDNRYEGELRAEWRDGDLVVEIEEGSSDGGDES